MKKIELPGGNHFNIYYSIKELPARRHMEFQKYLLQDAGVGCSIGAVNQHFQNLDMFLSKGLIEDAIRERINLHYNIFYMLEKIDIKSTSFACLIHSINDVEVNDYSEANLKTVIESLSNKGLKIGMVVDIIEEVKKNLFLN